MRSGSTRDTTTVQIRAIHHDAIDTSMQAKIASVMTSSRLKV